MLIKKLSVYSVRRFIVRLAVLSYNSGEAVRRQKIIVHRDSVSVYPPAVKYFLYFQRCCGLARP